MTKQKAQILAGLLAIAGFTGFFVFRTRGTENKEAMRSPRPNTERQIKDPTIQIALIENSSLDVGGQKNIFQYNQERLPPPTATTYTNPVSTAGNTTSVIDRLPLSSRRELSKTFKYDGFSIRGAPADGRMLASVSDGGNTYTLALGDCLVGQYCVRQLTENMIEIEDLQLKQRLTFPRTLP